MSNSSKLAKTKVSQAVFSALISSHPELVVDGKVQREGRKMFFDNMNVALAEQGDTMSKSGLSNYYARNKAVFEDPNKSFFQHNLTPKQRATKTAKNTQVNVTQPEDVQAPAADDNSVSLFKPEA